MLESEQLSSADWLRQALTTQVYLSEGILLQLAFLFLLSPLRADPYLAGPLVALYAMRENDKAAMKLYIALTVAALPLDLAAMASAAGFLSKLAMTAAFCLKAALLYPAVKAHDALPPARPEKTLLAEQNKLQLQVKVQETIAKALSEELGRLEWEAKSNAKPAAGRLAPPPQAAVPPPQKPPPEGQASASGASGSTASTKVSLPPPSAAVPSKPTKNVAGAPASWDEV